MKNSTDLLFGFTAKKPIVYITTGFWILTNGLFMPLQMKLKALSGTMVPDVVPNLDKQQLESIFNAYGVEGMDVYAQVGMVDIFLPLGYGLFFGSMIYLLFKESWIRNLAWVPIMAACFDYGENYCFGILSKDVLNLDIGLISTASYLINAKLLLIGIAMTTIVSGLIKRFILKR
jgi:hypothetical protein